MEFSSSVDSPLLLTTSKDGSIKIWCNVNNSWRCRSNTSYRSLVPVAAAWSHDSSTYAIAYPTSVLVIATDTGRLIHSFSCQDISPAYSIQFTGQEGTSLLTTGRMGTKTWDILNLEGKNSIPVYSHSSNSGATCSPIFNPEISSTTFQVNNIAVKPASNLTVGTESATEDSKRTTSSILIADYTSNLCQVATVPNLVCASIWVPQISSTFNDSVDISLATINERGQITLVGDSLIRSLEIPATSTHLPSASVNQSRLFEEIYGGSAPVALRKTHSSSPQLQINQSSAGILDIPALSLPPARLLWKAVLASFRSPSIVSQKSSQDDRKMVNSSTSYLKPYTTIKKIYFSSPDALIEIFQNVG